MPVEEKDRIVNIGLAVAAGFAGLAVAVAVVGYALARAAPLGFTLRIINAPEDAVLWDANFAENSFDYDPIADSGWLAISEIWKYPTAEDKLGNPLYCITLRVWALDADNNVLFDVYNLGPVESGKNYVYDCATGELFED